MTFHRKNSKYNHKDESAIYKYKTLSAIKRRKILKRTLLVILSTIALLIFACVIYLYFFL